MSRFSRALPLAAIGFALLVVGSGSASAATVSSSAAFSQTFAVTMPSVKADGSYTFTLQWVTKATDPNSVSPPVTDVEMKLPAGVEVRKQFLRGKYVCDVKKLQQTKDPNTCKSAQVGTGTVQMDLQPFTTQLIPANVYVFLAQGGDGAVAKLAILAVPNAAASAFVRDNPIIRDTKPVMLSPIYRDSTRGFGLRMEMPIDIDTPVLVSIQNFSVTIPGLSKKAKGKKLFWVSQPSCKSSKAKFQATFSYVNAATATLDTSVKRRFKCA